MKPVNEMDLKFLSRSSNESFARAAVAAFVAQIDPTIDELADIKTAVSEAVTNCIVHAYREDLGMIYINVKLFENGTIAIRVRDKGCGIENVKKAMEPMFTTAGGERAGLGFAVMESFMTVSYTHLYRGEKPVINSVTREENRFAPMVEAAKTCGAAMVALCMDDSGVPDGVERRIELANILTEKLRREGFEPEDIYLDPMVRPVGSGEGYGLEAVREMCIRDRYTADLPNRH